MSRLGREVCANASLTSFSSVLPSDEAERLFSLYQANVNYPAIERCNIQPLKRHLALSIKTAAYIEANPNTHEHGQFYNVPLSVCGNGIHGVCEMFTPIVVDNSHLDSHHEDY